MTVNSEADFFVSYNRADRTWAEWITWQLEAAGYHAIVQAWDFRPGSNFVLDMQQAASVARRTLAVLSPDYLTSLFTQPEWAAAFIQDPTGQKGTLFPVLVRPCELTGILSTIVYIDLVDLDENEAVRTLLAGIEDTRAKPTIAPTFPGSSTARATTPAPRFPGTLPPIWMVPFRRNPFFTGREALLSQLYEQLHQQQTAALTQAQAISGLGGIGKTQVAIEYAYRYRQDYRYIFWVRATMLDTLITDFINFARYLHLLEQDEQDQQLLVAATKRWLAEHNDWLLILDNANDLSLVSQFLPTNPNGHIIITTIQQAIGSLANKIEVGQMEEDAGTQLLLRRAKILTPDKSLGQVSEDELLAAHILVKEMDGLPLALDQAGAYIEQTSCGIANYLDRYQKERAKLLNMRGGFANDHPEPVVTIWTLSFKKVKKASRTAADLLTFCAFLFPEAIPEEIIIAATPYFGTFPYFLDPLQLEYAIGSLHNNSSVQSNHEVRTGVVQHIIQAAKEELDSAASPFKLDSAIEELNKYSLLQRDADAKTFSIHRLVQSVLKDEMNKKRQRRWALRVVRVLHKVFPRVEYENFQRCQQLLSQVQNCATSIEKWDFRNHEAHCLLDRAGDYLSESAQFNQAESFYKQAVTIAEKPFGANHHDVAAYLIDLAYLYETEGKFTEAEALYKRSLTIHEKVLGAKDLHTAISLNMLARLYQLQGKYEQAESYYKRALAIFDKPKSSKHLSENRNGCLRDLALLYRGQNKYDEATSLLEESLASEEMLHGVEHLNVADVLSTLALVHEDQKHYAQAEALFRRVLTIREKVLGPTNPYVADTLNDLAWLYQVQDLYSQAESFYQSALSIQEQALGPEHLEVAKTIKMLAHCQLHQEHYSEAETLYQRALNIRKQTFGPEHHEVAEILIELALLYRAQKHYDQAKTSLEQALAIQEKTFEPTNLEFAQTIYYLAVIYFHQEKYDQAESLNQRALAIREQVLGSEHPDVIVVLVSLINVYTAQGNYSEAESLYERVLTIQEKTLGLEHPDVVDTLKEFATLLQKIGKEDEAFKLEKRVQSIQTQNYIDLL